MMNNITMGISPNTTMWRTIMIYLLLMCFLIHVYTVSMSELAAILILLDAI